jgi:HEPN domain-containing protein
MQPNPPGVVWLTRQWLVRAQRDLRAAEHDATAVPSLRDMVVYHAQQAAEKALKAFLTWHNQLFPKTHDLSLLLQQCESIDGGFSAHRTAARLLTPYASHFRYPSSVEEPAQVDADTAVRLAWDVFRQVLSQLPNQTHP